MRYNTYWQGIECFETILSSEVEEVIFSPQLLSRFGSLSFDEIDYACEKLKSQGKRCVLEWDILMTENVFRSCLTILKKIKWDSFDAIRVQDPGALQYLLEETSDVAIQLILETGNHNYAGIQKWIELAGARLERVILSIEFSRSLLKELIPQISVETEVMGIGKLLLFYTPRSLMTPLGFTQQYQLAQSEESPHKDFTVLENKHGTFMFHPKDHSLLDERDELDEMNLGWFRLDCRHDLGEKVFNNALKPDWKQFYPRATIKGFYRANKSDVLFKKLKNQQTQRVDQNHFGEVVDVKKKEYIGILVKTNVLQNLSYPLSLSYKTPDGKNKVQEVSQVLNSQGLEVTELKAGQVIFVNHISGISPKSIVYSLP
jgi:U32 family peptidase